MRNKSISSAVPLLFTIIGYSLNGSFSIYRIIKLETFIEKALFLIMFVTYIIWSVWEIRITLGELKLEKAEKDSHTLEFAGIIKNFMLVSALAGTTAIYITSWSVGMCIMGIGLLLRVSAIKSIGSSYSHRVRELVCKPVTTGPYKIIRHPSYMGTLLIHAGLVVILFNIFSLIGLILWNVNAVYRIGVEEKLLFKNQHYGEYAKSTKYKLLPFIW